jgi:hypothetical protein
MVRQEGDELAFVGAGRVFRSNQCYDTLETLVREAHSRDPSGKLWRTRCTTPPSDPRRAAIDTVVSVANERHIDVVESGRYEVALTEGRCIADVRRSRTFDLVAVDSATTGSSTPTAQASVRPSASPNSCANPGDPMRLEVRPSRKLLRTGDAFAFRWVVVDGSGCATRTPTSWALAPSALGKHGLAIENNGSVTVAADAPEGTYELIATAAGRSVHVSVEVASPSHYDELLSASGLNDAGESEGASVTPIASESLLGADAKAEDGSRRRRNAFLGIVASLALGLGIVAVVGVRRSRNAAKLEREAQERHAQRLRENEARREARKGEYEAALRAHDASLAAAARLTAEEGQNAATLARMLCPACRREYDSGSVFCPHDSNRLVPINSPGGAAPGPSGGICPSCKRGFDPGIRVCPHDHEELIPYPLYASRGPPSISPPRGKICPTCGGRFDGNAAFCGKDGTALVLLN